MSLRRYTFRVEGLEDRRLLSPLPHRHFHHVAIHSVHHPVLGAHISRRPARAALAASAASPSPIEPAPAVPSVAATAPVISPPPAPAVTVIYPPPTGTSSLLSSP
jgi:hypothetical protein